jgi:hypothetical protein
MVTYLIQSPLTIYRMKLPDLGFAAISLRPASCYAIYIMYFAKCFRAQYSVSSSERTCSYASHP